MRKIYTLLLPCLIAMSVIAQEPNVTIRKCVDEETTPVIDGTVDDVWDYVEGNVMEEYGEPEPSIIEAIWKMMWSDESLIIYVSVDDDNHCDRWCTNLEDWQSDRVEIYLDVNEVLWDGLGANPDVTPGGPSSGHYQFTTPWEQDAEEATGTSNQWPSDNPYDWGYYLDGDYFDYEVSIPWTSLVDSTGVAFTPADAKIFGFQILMTDVDASDVNTPKYLHWCENVSPWDNMDSAGVIQLSEASVTGIYNHEAIKTINVYPNPARNYITISAEMGTATEVRIYNTVGQEVLWIEKYNGERIYLAGLKTGLYYAVVYDNKRRLLGKNKFTIIK